MQERLNRLYEQYGYRKFKMSRFEDYDLYAQNRDFLRQDRIITFTDADGALKALKPDITLSIMKSNGGDSEKVYYNENVCREVGGAFREILQVGVESVGQIDPYAEAEVIALAARSLEQLSPKYVLALSDVSFVGSLLDQMGLSAPVRGKVLGFIARKNVPGLCVLAERGELTGEQADGLRELVELYAPLKEGIGRVGRLAKSNAAWEALRQLSLTAGLLESFGLEERVRLDFSLVNSMDYYNGVIFQGFLPGLHTPVLSGGRYDNLPRKMGKQVGAIGFALYLDALENLDAAPEGTPREMLSVALPKGRLGDKVYDLLAGVGCGCPEGYADSRRLVVENPAAGIRYFLVKPSDVGIYVERGAADIGIVGKDILAESGADVYELLDTGLGRCRMCVAGPKDFADDPGRTLRVATKFPRIARDYYAAQGRDIDIIKLNGSIELAPILGLSDVIVDIVETGTTLRENDLKVITEFMPISARLIANRSSYLFKRRAIDTLVSKLAEVTEQ